MNETVSNWALHAFADGELDGQEKRAIEDLLQRDETARRFVALISAQKQALHAALDGTLQEQVPTRLLAAARGTKATLFSARSLAAVAAAMMLIVCGALIGLMLAERFATVGPHATLADLSYGAYKVYAGEQRHPVEVTAADKDHLQTWLSHRVGVKFAVPDLTQKGFALVGGRLLAEGEKPAGLLVYEDKQLHRITIYVAANEAKNQAPMAIEQHGQVMNCYWVEADLVYAVSGELPRDQMLSIAQAAHEGFDKEG